MSSHEDKQFNRDFIYHIPSKILFHKELTFLQKQIYAIVRSFMDTTGDAYPSNNWIARMCGVERNAVIVGIKALMKKNLIERIMIDGKRHLAIVTRPMPAQDLDELDSLPSIPTNTPPSIPTNTQLDQKNINSNCDVGQPSTIDFSEYKKNEIAGLETASRESQKQSVEHEAITNPKNIELFKQKFGDREITIEELFLGCQEYYAQKGGWIGSQRFQKWIRNENSDNYPKKGSHESLAKTRAPKLLSDEDEALLAEYKHWLKTSQKFVPLEKWIANDDKRSRAIDLYNQELTMMQRTEKQNVAKLG